MSNELSKAQAKQVAEKAAIIANTAFGLGRDAERAKLVTYIKGQQCITWNETGSCEHDNCPLLADIIAYANQEQK